jgi:hypothetical protein
MMLSTCDEDSYQLTIRENLPDEVTPQVLSFRVAPVYVHGEKDVLGIWVRHYEDADNGNKYNPIILDIDTWKAVDRYIREEWRIRAWVKYSVWDKIVIWVSKLDIRLL